jgi:hypothetical protein
MSMQRGTITRIDTRGRVTVHLRECLVVAEIHSGSGGCIGDVVEGEMRQGFQSWRNVGSNILSVVNVIEQLTQGEHCIEPLKPPPPRRERERRNETG